MSQTLGKTRLAYSRTWHYIDVGSDTRSLGRVATSIATFLMGKHKPIWDPSTDCGDYVVAVGCHDLHVTGKKREQKQYYTHNTRPGSLKQMSMERMIEKWGGGEVLKKAVRGMLPKNRLRDKRLARLKVFEGTAHPYKQNIVRFAGKPHIPGKVMEAIEATKSAPPSS
ncbi:54S ribosomal protein L23, mitochondrial [Exophiala xenobiotica]|nr:54S ribosomal protein L23, mitochondrial [Exophiala xenobiotica]KAK5208627.1 54S ribosomal protein L23, mitochondrial [Exophiala xenobiotica]KAK5229910.1 54S ribosomal protein L23, mitochondrial [Exophiala xenobiotica]KAK5234750.1 54S ribosomal protein L23, mitochondrial [Exophiala xenobiotica]KAK5251741.1 54S ribosomal protein L23, mitochondrial [Exophiala xenobiotica]